MLRVLTVSFVAMLACSLGHAGDQPKDKFAELQGTWIIVKMEIQGKSLMEKDKKWKVVIKDGKARFDTKDAPKADPIVLAKVLDVSKKPKTVTVAFEEKLTFYGIYEVKGVELRVCGEGVDTATEKNPEARRPKKFDSDVGLLLVFKREAQEKKVPPKNFTNSIGMKFVWIPPGSFMMGSTKAEMQKEPFDILGFRLDEGQHKVTLTPTTISPSSSATGTAATK
jgi:uncharacterized protein (TIGR03067 family)